MLDPLINFLLLFFITVYIFELIFVVLIAIFFFSL